MKIFIICFALSVYAYAGTLYDNTQPNLNVLTDATAKDAIGSLIQLETEATKLYVFIKNDNETIATLLPVLILRLKEANANMDKTKMLTTLNNKIIISATETGLKELETEVVRNAK